MRLLGGPREKYHHWLAHISPNDEELGHRLAREVVQRARIKKSCIEIDCNVNVFGISGLKYASVSRQRQRGLKSWIQQDGNSILYNVVDGRWRESEASNITARSMIRHPEVDAYWIASDIMAYGAIDALSKLTPTKRDMLVVGSIDWSPRTIPLINTGAIDVSLGGHFMEGGLALKLFFLYERKIDSTVLNDHVYTTIVTELDRTNTSTLGSFLTKPKWSASVVYEWIESATTSSPNFDTRSLLLNHISSSQTQD